MFRSKPVVFIVASQLLVLAGVASVGCGPDCRKTLTCGDGATDGGGGAGGSTASTGGSSVTTGGGGDLGLGASCNDPGACASGLCVDGVCCATACDGVCEACNLPGFEGACGPHAEGTDPDAECGQGTCSGASECNNGTPIWSHAYGDSNLDEANAIALDADDNIYIAGSFEGTLTIGSETLQSAGDRDAFIAKLTSAGDVVWAKGYGSAAYESATGIVATPMGLFAIGEYQGVSPSIGATQLPNSTYTGTWVGSFDSNGDATSAVGNPGPINLKRHATGITYSSGALYMASEAYTGKVGGGRIDKIDPSTLATDDTIGWASPYRLTLATASNGDILVCGWFDESTSFGGPMLTPQERDGFVLRLTPTLSHVWSTIVGGAGFDGLNALVERASGTIAAVGSNSSSFSFGGSPIATGGSSDMMIVEISANGVPQGGSSIGGLQHDEAHAVAVDADDNLVVAGTFMDNVIVHDQTIVSQGLKDLLFIKFNPEGEIAWTFSAGGTDDQLPSALAIDSADLIDVVGTFEGDLTLDAPYTSITSSDAFVVQLNP